MYSVTIVKIGMPLWDDVATVDSILDGIEYIVQNDLHTQKDTHRVCLFQLDDDGDYIGYGFTLDKGSCVCHSNF